MLGSPSTDSAEEKPPLAPGVKLKWHIVTCEFPPQLGGVSDYTCHLARGLTLAGEEVHVWCPEHAKEDPHLAGPIVHGELGDMSPARIYRMDRKITGLRAPTRILVQWVPHGYKYKSLNIVFCLWVLKRALINYNRVDLMVHEPFLSLTEGSWLQTLVALFHRVMIICLLAAASKVWMATSSWERSLRPYALRRNTTFAGLPIPSNVSVHSDPVSVNTVRRRYCPKGKTLLGHFGTYGRPIAAMLANLIPTILESSEGISLLLIGKNSREFHASLVCSHPNLAGKIHSTGSLNSPSLSCHIQSCDLFLQPYPDGVTTRHGSVMACLAHGKAIVTTTGHLTEPFWLGTEALVLSSSSHMPTLAAHIQELIGDDDKRKRLGEAARSLYLSRFDLSHTIDTLLIPG